MLRDARAVQDAGAFALVLELVPAPLAGLITEMLHIPTIGIGAGDQCSGQVQVFHDILGLFEAFVPKHTRQYARIGELIREAISEYRNDVSEGRFPTAEQSFSLDEEVLAMLRTEVRDEGS